MSPEGSSASETWVQLDGKPSSKEVNTRTDQHPQGPHVSSPTRRPLSRRLALEDALGKVPIVFEVAVLEGTVSDVAGPIRS